MLTDPFRGNLRCIREVARFLLRQLDDVRNLWSESFEDRWVSPRLYSVWASADILGALSEVADLALECNDSDLLSLREEIIKITPLVVQSILAVAKEVDERAKDELDKGLPSLKPARDRFSLYPNALEEVLREVQGNIGFPRTTTGETGMPGFPNTLATCAVLNTLRKVTRLCGSDMRADMNKRQQDLAEILRSPELGILRAALDRSASYLTEPAFKDALVDACASLSAKWNSTKPPNPIPIDAKKPIDWLEQQLKDANVTPGLICADMQSHFGWPLVPLQPGSELDILSTIGAIEVLLSAASDAVSKTDTTVPACLDAVAAARPFIDQYFAAFSPLPGDDCWAKLRKDQELSSRFPLGLLTRVAIWSRTALDHLERIDHNLDERVATIQRWFSSLHEVVYTALLIRTFRTFVEDRSVPFEPHPTPITTGNDISHWPGIDVGHVALALLRGRSKYRWRKAIGRFAELDQKFVDPRRIFALLPSRDLPHDFPLFSTCIDAVKRQIVGPQVAATTKSKLPGHIRGEVDSGELSGAFVSSVSYAAPHAVTAIYLWSTSHVLYALVEWQKAAGDVEQQKERQQLDALKSKVDKQHEEVVAHKLVAIPGRRVGLLIATLLAVLLTVICFADGLDGVGLVNTEQVVDQSVEARSGGAIEDSPSIHLTLARWLILSASFLWFVYLWCRLLARLIKVLRHFKVERKRCLYVVLLHVIPTLALPLLPITAVLIKYVGGPLEAVLWLVLWHPVLACLLALIFGELHRNWWTHGLREVIRYSLLFTFGEGTEAISVKTLQKFGSLYSEKQ